LEGNKRVKSKGDRHRRSRPCSAPTKGAPNFAPVSHSGNDGDWNHILSPAARGEGPGKQKRIDRSNCKRCERAADIAETKAARGKKKKGPLQDKRKIGPRPAPGTSGDSIRGKETIYFLERTREKDGLREEMHALKENTLWDGSEK